MSEAQDILRANSVEIDASDHRSPEEIVAFLGLSAITLTENTVPLIEKASPKKSRTSSSPYLAH